MTGVVLLAVVWLAALGGTQDPPPQPPPSFKSGVQLVEVDVRVFGKEGRFVPDLTRDDFELIEDGVPQSIAELYGVRPRSDPGARAGSDLGLTPVRPQADAGAARQTWIFHFDLNHLTPGSGYERARKAVEEFIRDRFKEGDVAGILAGDKMINNRLTSVRQELLDAVKQVKPRNDAMTRFIELSREWPRLLNEEEALRIARGEREPMQRATTRACSDDPDQCPVADSAVRQKGARLAVEIQRASLETIAALNRLAAGLSRIPGPKTVVLLSDGFVAQEVESTLRTVVGQIVRSGARVYAIDVRGLNRFGGSNLFSQDVAEDSAGPTTKFDDLADGMNSVAVDTGGLMIRNENNIGRALDRVAEDAGRYYVLAYQPANTNFDGKFRTIQVRVKREGLRVRARRGYLALPPARMLLPQPIKPPDVEPPPDAEAAPGAAAPSPAVTPAPSPADAPPATTNAANGPDAAPGSFVKTDPSPEAPGAVRLRPDAADRVNALSAREPAASNELTKRGWDAYQRGDIEAAEEAFSRAAATADVRPWVLYALGMTQVGLGRIRDAIGSWERVRTAVPDFEPVYMDLADTYAATGDLTTALAIVREAAQRWPASPDVHSAIGVIHVRRGAIDDGIASLARASELAPDDALTHLNLGRAYAMRYHRGRRYVTSQRRWIAPEADRDKALDALRRCAGLGGPYAQQARDEIAALEWRARNP